MKPKPKSQEYKRFEIALGRVLQVSKTDMNRMLEEERKAKEGKPKPGPKPKHSSSSVPASADSDTD